MVSTDVNESLFSYFNLTYVLLSSPTSHEDESLSYEEEEDNSDQTSVFSALSFGNESRVSAEAVLTDEEWPVDMGEGSNFITLPQGVRETVTGSWEVRVYYQSSLQYIGTFQTLEQATLANEIARSMFKKDEGLELSDEECQRNIKLAKEAASASCIKRGRGRPKKANQTLPVVLVKPGHDLEVNDRRGDLDGGVSTNGRKRKLSRKMADALDPEAEKKQPIKSIQQSDLSAKKRQKKTPNATDKPGNESKTSVAYKLPQGVYETPNGTWQVRVWYQSSQRTIGTFPTLELATLANEIARNMLKKDKGLQLSAEEYERSFEQAKEAALTTAMPDFKSSKRVKPNEPLNDIDKKRVNTAIEAVTTYGVGVDMQTKLAAAVLRGVTVRPSGKCE